MHKREFFEYKAVLTPFLSKNKAVSKRIKALCMRNSCTPMLLSLTKKAGKNPLLLVDIKHLDLNSKVKNFSDSS